MRRLATCLILLPLALACGGGGDSSDSNEIKIGAIFDLSGPTADVGTDYAEGIQGYVAWLNAQGGIAGRPIDLIFQDYAYDVSRAEQLYSQFVQEGVVAFMGWGTGDTEALQRRIVEDQLPFTSASLSHRLGNPEEAPYNFLVAATYSDQFFIVLDWIKEDFAARGETGPPTRRPHAQRQPVRLVALATGWRGLCGPDRSRRSGLRDAPWRDRPYRRADPNPAGRRAVRSFPEHLGSGGAGRP